MRTIKFRGKSKLNGEWVYGDLVKCMSDDIKIVNSNRPESLSYRISDIQSDSVGQFTGLLDKNGKEIYEGDIINMHTKSYGDEIFIIAYEDSHLGAFALCEGDVYSRFVCVFGKDFGYEPFYCEVIGNIHDNPELLKNNG